MVDLCSRRELLLLWYKIKACVRTIDNSIGGSSSPVLCLLSVLALRQWPLLASVHTSATLRRVVKAGVISVVSAAGFAGFLVTWPLPGILSRDCTAVHWTRQTCYSLQSKQTAARPQDNTGTLTIADTRQTEHQEKNDVKPNTLVMVAICEGEDKQPLFLRIT